LLARLRSQWIVKNDTEFVRALDHALALVRLQGLEGSGLAFTSAYLMQDDALRVVRHCLVERIADQKVYVAIEDVIRKQTEWQKAEFSWDIGMLTSINGMLFIGGVDGAPTVDETESSWAVTQIENGVDPEVGPDRHPRLLPLIRSVVDRSQDPGLAFDQAIVIDKIAVARGRLTTSVQSIFDAYSKLGVVCREVPAHRYAAGWRLAKWREQLVESDFVELLWYTSLKGVYELDHLRTTAAGALAVVAIEAHRAKTGSYPESLDAIRDQVPKDPLTNGPWTYRVLDARMDSHRRPFLLSSRGFDQVDNNEPLQASGDRAWHIDDYADKRDFVVTDGALLPSPPK
jgi:hypothetical protein